ncbi:MAG TPA: FliH/SctL family protein [Acidisarcina sp.]
MSISSTKLSAPILIPMSSLTYQDSADIAAAARAKGAPSTLDLEHEKQQVCVLTIQERDEMVAAATAEGAASRDVQIRHEFEANFQREAAGIANAIQAFVQEQQNYFARVEQEVVSLALAIAAKILHREAQVDSMLLAALVRVAVNQLHDGSKVSVRIRPGEAARWNEFFRNQKNRAVVEVIEDSNLGADDCILETDLGSSNFSIDGQLKEVEKGFFDLLALRPGK